MYLDHLGLVREGLELCYQMAVMEKPANFDYLVGNWSRLLKEIPSLYIERSFYKALQNNNRSKIPSVYQVLEAGRSIQSVVIDRPISNEKKENIQPEDLPDHEQHKKAVQTIMAVIDGRIKKEDGMFWLEKIFSGKVRDHKNGLES